MGRKPGCKPLGRHTPRKKAETEALPPPEDEFAPLQMRGEPIGGIVEDEPPPDDDEDQEHEPAPAPEPKATKERTMPPKAQSEAQRDVKAMDALLPTGVRVRVSRRDAVGKVQIIGEYTRDELSGEPIETFVLNNIRKKYPDSTVFPITLIDAEGKETPRAALDYAPIVDDKPSPAAPPPPPAGPTYREQLDLAALARQMASEEREREERAAERALRAQEQQQQAMQNAMAAATNGKGDGGAMAIMAPLMFSMMFRPAPPAESPRTSRLEALADDIERKQREREREDRPRPAPFPMLPPPKDDGIETAKMIMEGLKTFAEILRPPVAPGLTRADVIEIVGNAGKKEDGIGEIIKAWGPTIVGGAIPLIKGWMDSQRETQQRLMELQLQSMQQPTIAEKLEEFKAMRDMMKEVGGTDGAGGGFFDAIGKIADKFGPALLGAAQPGYKPAQAPVPAPVPQVQAPAPKPAIPAPAPAPKPEEEEEGVLLTIPIAYMPYHQAMLAAIVENNDGNMIGALMGGIQYLGKLPDWQDPLMGQMKAVWIRGKIALVEFVRGFLEGALMGQGVMTQEQVERVMVAVEANGDELVDLIKRAASVPAEAAPTPEPAPAPAA